MAKEDRRPKSSSPKSSRTKAVDGNDMASLMARLPAESSYLNDVAPSSGRSLPNFPNGHPSGGFPQPDFFSAPPAFDSSSALWTGSEEADIFGFLNQFESHWEFNPMLPNDMPTYPGDSFMHGDQDNERGRRLSASLDADHFPSMSQTSLESHSTIVPRRSGSGTPSHNARKRSRSARSASSERDPRPSTVAPANTTGDADDALLNKPILTGSQKRLNHVKSEKRRRDTIRDGYLTLTKLLSPPNSHHLAIPIPRRGRPKGSGRQANGIGGKKEGKGKSGVLFRAVEYIRFLEEAVGGLEGEIDRLEALASGPGRVSQW